MSGNVVDLSKRRQPVVYSVDICHSWDGQLSVQVNGIADDPRSRSEAAHALRRAADLVDSDAAAIQEEE
jgi:hypothetical protein